MLGMPAFCSLPREGCNLTNQLPICMAPTPKQHRVPLQATSPGSPNRAGLPSHTRFSGLAESTPKCTRPALHHVPSNPTTPPSWPVPLFYAPRQLWTSVQDLCTSDKPPSSFCPLINSSQDVSIIIAADKRLYAAQTNPSVAPCTSHTSSTIRVFLYPTRASRWQACDAPTLYDPIRQPHAHLFAYHTSIPRLLTM